jgi:ubiquinone/menaquinone biosynthesis C-methylase UbiE
MTLHQSDKHFTGSIPEIYETLLVPLIFVPYAEDLARRTATEPVSKVLEIAAGTGVATRATVDALGPDVSIVATDLNQAMLDHAATVRADANVEWRQCNALDLPFADASFDAVLCQFSVMFFPDRVKAYCEARRVLKPGGRFLFNVWDEISDNEFAHTVTESLKEVFPDNPPEFLPRTPHGYTDTDQIRKDLRNAGFTASAEIDTLEARSIADDPIIPAVAYCQGTPLRNEIEARDETLLQHATEVAGKAVSERFGSGVVDGKIQAIIISVAV